ncbi:MAG: dTDP-glucose 4,6-dehydratase [Candidatus Latescibacteria bacterium]|nr:dTDP-glucose 4,6-dehydratase [Candidatus Latescibacterota bacterium]
MQILLVTGGAGFIGSNFVRYLLRTYPTYRVVVLDALTYAGNLANLADLEGQNRFEFVHGNICDRTVVEPLVRRVDGIVNFAAETHVDRSILDAGAFIETDVKGTYILLETARQCGVERYVQISTDEVYGSVPVGVSTETDPLVPRSPYAASKAGAELLVRAYVVTYGLPAVITRGSNTIGPYQYPEKAVPLFITNALEDKPLPLYGDGKAVRDYLYVEDHCAGIDVVLHHGMPGDAYNIGAGNEINGIDLATRILDLVGKPQSLKQFVIDRPGHDRRYALDCTRLQALGWRPRHSFEDALAKTVAWYRSHESWWRTIKEQQAAYRDYYRQQYELRSQSTGE